MSNLTEHCLDGWDALTKKTSATLEGVKGLQSFLKNLGENLHKFSSEMQSTCSKYKGKKVEMLEGTVKAAVIAVMSEIEVTLCEPHQSLARELDNIQKEIGGFLKDSEKSRKRLLTEAANMRKTYEASLAALKKSREAYHKAAKEAASLQNAGKAGKASSAEEKARSLDKAYGDQLVATNDKQHAYYTEEQPVLLAQFQQWEEARIEFVKKQLVAFGEKLTQIDIQGSWGKVVESVRSCSEDIDEKADMECYARSIDTGVTVPGDIQYEAAPEGPSVGAPSSISTHGGGGGSSSSGGGGYSSDPFSGKAHAEEPTYSSADDAGGSFDDTPAQDSGAASGGGELYKALYDYEPTNDGEMVMHSGETLRITEKDSSGWWFAVAEDGREGFVPEAYVEPL